MAGRAGRRDGATFHDAARLRGFTVLMALALVALSPLAATAAGAAAAGSGGGAATGPASAQGNAGRSAPPTFDVADVLALVKREVVVADALGAGALHIEEVQIDLDLVELPQGRGAPQLAVPGIASPGMKDGPRDGAAKPVLRRHLSLAFTLPKGSAPLDATAGGAGEAGNLPRMIAGLMAAVQSGMETAPAGEPKRAGIDLEFSLERDSKGAPVVVVFAPGRPIEASAVHKLRLKCAVRDNK